MSLARLIISEPSLTIRELPGIYSDLGVPPPKASQPIPLSSITTPGSKGDSQLTPGTERSTMFFPNGSLHGPTGEVEVSMAVPMPLLE